MSKKTIRRFALSDKEAIAMIGDYLHDHCGLDDPVVEIYDITCQFRNRVTVEVEVEEK